MKLISNHWGDAGIESSIRDLFNEDGTIYLVPGYFSWNAFQRLQPAIETFLSRSTENTLFFIVTPTADQFHPAIAKSLEAMPGPGTVTLLRHPEACLHAKVYLRTGEEPLVIVGSTNLTTVAFKQNIELSVQFDGDTINETAVLALEEWVESLVEESIPLKPRDLYRTSMLLQSIRIWSRKAQLLPRRAFFNPSSLALLLVVLGGILFFF